MNWCKQTVHKKFQRWNYIIRRFPRGIVPVIPKLVCYWSYPSGTSMTMTNCRCLIPYQNRSSLLTGLVSNIMLSEVNLHSWKDIFCKLKNNILCGKRNSIQLLCKVQRHTILSLKCISLWHKNRLHSYYSKSWYQLMVSQR